MNKPQPQKRTDGGITNDNYSAIMNDQKKIELSGNAAVSASVSKASKDAAFLSEIDTFWSDNIYTNLLAEAAEAIKQNVSNFYTNSNTYILHSIERHRKSCRRWTEEETHKDKYVTVKSVAIDDIIHNKIRPTNNCSLLEAGNTSESLPNIDRLYLLKLDFQGNEPSVFSRITKSIREHNIDSVFTEYWPKVIDLMNDSMGAGNECLKLVGMLQILVGSGYTLYTLAANVDPRAPKDGALARLRRHNEENEMMPINSLTDYCMWFCDLERKCRDGDGMTKTGRIYEFGYWNDALAVRPGFKFPDAPVTKTGKIIAQSLNLVH